MDSIRQFFSVFNQIQTLAHTFSLSLDFPQIIVVGKQSAGKSSLLQAFAGFPFNLTKENIGTRRPCVFQFKTDESCDEPVWSFNGQRMTTQEVRTLLQEKNNIAGITTEAIILECRFKNSYNMSIVDLPGLRSAANTESDATMNQSIATLVKNYVANENSIILCVESAHEDYANCQTLSFIKTVDKNLERTVLVFNKLDMRLTNWQKGGGTPESRLQYFLKADETAFSADIPRFYTSLPVVDNIPNMKIDDYVMELRKTEEQVIAGVLHFTNNQVPNDILGIEPVYNHLTKILMSKFKSKVSKIWTTIVESIEVDKKEVQKLEILLLENDETQYLRKLESIGSNFCKHIIDVLNGDGSDQIKHLSQSLSDEYKDMGSSFTLSKQKVELLDGVLETFKRKYVGGSQILRLLDEMEVLVRSMEIALPSMEELDNYRGISKTGGTISWREAAQKAMTEITIKGYENLLNFINSRIEYLLLRMKEITILTLDEADKQTIFENFTFKSMLEEKYNSFVKKMVNNFAETSLDHCRTLCDSPLQYYMTDSVSVSDNNKQEEILSDIQRIKKEMSKKLSIPYTDIPDQYTLDLKLYEKLKHLVNASAMKVKQKIAEDLRFMFNFYLKNPLIKDLSTIYAGLLHDKLLREQMIAQIQFNKEEAEKKRNYLQKGIAEKEHQAGSVNRFMALNTSIK